MCSTDNTFPPLSKLFSLFVLNQQLSLLPVPSRLLLRHPDNLDPRQDPVTIHRSSLPEDSIHLFKGAVCGFRVEEVDRGDDEGVDDGEDHICLVSKMVTQVRITGY